MKDDFPTDPLRLNDRLIDALCQDWLEAGTVTRVTPRANAVLEISRQLADVSTAQEVGDASGPGSRAAHGTSLPPSGLRSVSQGEDQ